MLGAFRLLWPPIAHASRLLSTESVAVLQPQRLSAFTGKPSFYEALFFFDDILLKLRPLSKSLSTTAGQSVQWHGKQELSDALGMGLSTLQHRKVKDKLAALACYAGVPEIREFLVNFTADSAVTRCSSAAHAAAEAAPSEAKASLADKVRRYGRTDELGRAVATGKRKAATAKAYLVPGEGLCYVNGKPAAEYFPRLNDMFRLAAPFQATSTFGRFNVWALVRGGGATGQAGAVALATARVLVVRDAQHLAVLSPCKGPWLRCHADGCRGAAEAGQPAGRAQEARAAQGPQEVCLGQALMLMLRRGRVSVATRCQQVKTHGQSMGFKIQWPEHRLKAMGWPERRLGAKWSEHVFKMRARVQV